MWVVCGGPVLGFRRERVFKLSRRRLLFRVGCERLCQLSGGHKVVQHWHHSVYELHRGQVLSLNGKHCMHLVWRRILPSQHGRDKLQHMYCWNLRGRNGLERLRELSRRISRLGMVTDLRRLDGRLVLMVYIPSTHDAGATSYWLESLAVGEGELLIAGETRSTAASRPLTNPPSS